GRRPRPERAAPRRPAPPRRRGGRARRPARQGGRERDRARAPQGRRPLRGLMAFPPAQGARIPWEAVPEGVREAVETGLGSRVADSVTQPGGFSPGVAARLRLDDGRTAFVKAVGSEPNPESPDFHRSEESVAAALHPTTQAPKYLFVLDDGSWDTHGFTVMDG